MLDEIESKTELCITMKVIDREKKSNTISEDKSVENISKKPQSFLEMSPVEKEVFLSHKLQDQLKNPLELKEDNPSEKSPEWVIQFCLT